MLPSQLLKHPSARWRNRIPVDPEGRAVVYWMQRAQRAVDNPALDYAIHAANALGTLLEARGAGTKTKRPALSALVIVTPFNIPA